MRLLSMYIQSFGFWALVSCWKQFEQQQILQCLHCVLWLVWVNNRWVSSREPQQLPLFVEPIQIIWGKVSQTHSSSAYLRDCVMAAGGRVTQHEEWSTDSENKGRERQKSTTVTANVSDFKLQHTFLTGNKLCRTLKAHTHTHTEFSCMFLSVDSYKLRGSLFTKGKLKALCD